ncbi:hypothetical protein ACFC0M_02800 [Streptomyces sp. NPDC056149]|uniref:hypothetical protein n=1 Tax=unclassified Streptomyces TaxID=2593676 RepID=UPI00238106D3|nr:hypothetical protein [Streptomyces sp. WZ-12]
MVTPPSGKSPSDVALLQRHFAVRALVLAVILGITGEALLSLLVVLVGLGFLVFMAE